MRSRERVLKTLNLEEPDMVPIAEMMVDISVMEKILGEKITVQYSGQSAVIVDRGEEKAFYDVLYKVYRSVGFDIVYAYQSLPDGYQLRRLPSGQLVDEIGRVFSYDEVSKTYTPVGTVFNTIEEVESFLESMFPDPNAPGRDFGLKYLSKLNRDDKAVGVFLRDPFAHVWEALTPTKFVRWMYSNPVVIRRFIEKIADFNVKLIKIYGELGVLDVIVCGGDLADAKGPMLPLDRFRGLGVFTAMKKQVEAAHRYGVKYIKHTDGFVVPLLDDLINNAMVDGVHSLDPSTGVDIGEVKEKYGDKLVLYGNVSVDNLATKGREDIVEETKNVIKKASPGGGHILSSSNSWYGGVKLENCLTMVETGRRYGRYPINIP